MWSLICSVDVVKIEKKNRSHDILSMAGDNADSSLEAWYTECCGRGNGKFNGYFLNGYNL